MNPTTNDTPVITFTKRKYIRKVKPALVVVDEESVSKSVSESVSKSVSESVSVAEPELVETQDAEGDDDDNHSTISAITEEVEEEEAIFNLDEEAEMILPVLESDPILLQKRIFNLEEELIRLMKFNHYLQRRAQGDRKQPKTKEAKEAKAKAEGTRTNTRAKRPSDYAEKYLEKGQVLRWEHKTRKVWGEATYIGDNKFFGKFSFVPEGEFPEEFPSLNALAKVMLKHLGLMSLNAWSAFKTLDGKSVENLDLQATA